MRPGPTIGRWVFGLLFIGAGVGHFVAPQVYLKIMPPSLPEPKFLVYLSGFFEILGGVGLLIPGLTRPAAWGLIALLIAVFPANLHMYTHRELFAIPPILLLLRLPLQALLIGWAWTYTRSPS